MRLPLASPSRRKCLRVVGVGLLLLGQLVIAPPRTVLAATLTVNPATGTVNPGDPCPNPPSSAIYKTIQKAVTCANAGDTINAAAGTYAENVNVNKPVILRGANAGQDARLPRGTESVVDAGLVSAAFAMNAAGATLDGFRIQRGQNGLNAGIWLGAANVHILNNIIIDNAIGLSATGAVSAAIQRNLFVGNNRLGTSAGGTGLYTDVSTNLSVSSNTFLNHTANLAVNFAAAGASAHTGLTFFDNYLANNRIGVNAMGLAGGTLHDNVFVGNTTALVFNGASNGAVVRQNFWYGNTDAIRTANPYGLGNNSNLVVAFNRLIDNSTAIRVVVGYSGVLNAENNWWGCSYGPGAGGSLCSKASNGVIGSVDANPWLTLRLLAAPASVGQNGGRAFVTADLTFNSIGQDTVGAGFVPNGTPAQFTATLGAISPTATTSAGQAISTFTAGATLGVAHLSATVDYQSVAATVAITPNYLHLPVIFKSP